MSEYFKLSAVSSQMPGSSQILENTVFYFEKRSDTELWLTVVVGLCNVHEAILLTKNDDGTKWSSGPCELAQCFAAQSDGQFELNSFENGLRVNGQSIAMGKKERLDAQFTTPTLQKFNTSDKFLRIPKMSAPQLWRALHRVTVPADLDLLDMSSLSFESDCDLWYALFAVRDVLSRSNVVSLCNVLLPHRLSTTLGEFVVECLSMLLPTDCLDSIEHLDLSGFDLVMVNPLLQWLPKCASLKPNGLKLAEENVYKLGGKVNESLFACLVHSDGVSVSQPNSLVMSQNDDVTRTDLNFDVVAAALEVDATDCFDIDKFWPMQAFSVFGSGAGVRVAVLDSGVDIGHPRVSSSVKEFRSFVSNEHGFFDITGHGTRCASLVATVAPDAQLYVGNVINGGLDALIEGIYWAVEDVKCNVLSLSLGVLSYSSSLQHAIQMAVSCGVVVVCAAANQGRLRLQNIAFPAAFGNVICVGSHDRFGRVSRFSSAGREVEFLAPGEAIKSANTNTGTENGANGTSVATPLVAGLVALMCAFLAPHGIALDCEGARLALRSLCSSREHDPVRGFGVLNGEDLAAYGTDWFLQALSYRGVGLDGFSTLTITPLDYLGKPTSKGAGVSSVSVQSASVEWFKNADTDQTFIGVLVCGFAGRKRKACPPGTLLLFPSIAPDKSSNGQTFQFNSEAVPYIMKTDNQTAHEVATALVVRRFEVEHLACLGCSATKTGDNTIKFVTRSGSLNTSTKRGVHSIHWADNKRISVKYAKEWKNVIVMGLKASLGVTKVEYDDNDRPNDNGQ